MGHRDAETQRGDGGSGLTQREYRSFTHKDAVLRICCTRFEAVTQAIVEQRGILEDYLARHRAFGRSFSPMAPVESAPECARRMARAAQLVGVGPMAAVAGTMAQLAAEAGLAAGADEAIVENGGDMFLHVTAPIVVGLYAGKAEVGSRLAFSIEPGQTPLAVCSSSGAMGHSTSLGRCDLATVVSRDASLADAAATDAANRVNTVDDIDEALNHVSAIRGIDGALVAHGGRVGMVGRLPKLVRIDAKG